MEANSLGSEKRQVFQPSLKSQILFGPVGFQVVSSLVGEKRHVMTLIMSAEETSFQAQCCIKQVLLSLIAVARIEKEHCLYSFNHWMTGMRPIHVILEAKLQQGLYSLKLLKFHDFP